MIVGTTVLVVSSEEGIRSQKHQILRGLAPQTPWSRRVSRNGARSELR
jgi:hypothetical protein